MKVKAAFDRNDLIALRKIDPYRALPRDASVADSMAMQTFIERLEAFCDEVDRLNAVIRNAEQRAGIAR